MKFDKSKVFTTANADELKIGSKAIFADNFAQLREKVEDGTEIYELKCIESEAYPYRFYVGFAHYLLAYLVSEPEEKTLKWTDLKVGDIIRKKDGTKTGMVTGIDNDAADGLHIFAVVWISDKALEKWEKV